MKTIAEMSQMDQDLQRLVEQKDLMDSRIKNIQRELEVAQRANSQDEVNRLWTNLEEAMEERARFKLEVYAPAVLDAAVENFRINPSASAWRRLEECMRIYQQVKKG